MNNTYNLNKNTKIVVRYCELHKKDQNFFCLNES